MDCGYRGCFLFSRRRDNVLSACFPGRTMTAATLAFFPSLYLSVGRRLHGFLGLSLNYRTLLFLVILLERQSFSRIRQSQSDNIVFALRRSPFLSMRLPITTRAHVSVSTSISFMAFFYPSVLKTHPFPPSVSSIPSPPLPIMLCSSS